MSVMAKALWQASTQAGSATGVQPQEQDGASLSRLHDVIEPEALSLWPPAPIWWVLVGVVLAWVLLAIVWGWRLYRGQAYRRAALAELASIQPHALELLPALLKRTALAGFPREQVASLSGKDWLSFLDRTSGTTAFTNGAGRLLLSLTYESKQPDPTEAARLIEVARGWIRRHGHEEQG